MVVNYQILALKHRKGTVLLGTSQALAIDIQTYDVLHYLLGQIEVYRGCFPVCQKSYILIVLDSRLQKVQC
jgi:hypothetical protein